MNKNPQASSSDRVAVENVLKDMLNALKGKIMVEYINEYLSMFTQRSEYIKNEVNQSIEYWLPDDPPTILLFSLVGKALVNQLVLLRESDKLNFFQHIEMGITSENTDLATAVATGLVEALVTASDEDESVWEKIENYLHSESKNHALSWRDFGK